MTSSTEEHGFGCQSGDPQQRRIAVGRVGRPHGLDGSFHVTGANGRLLGVGATVQLGGRPRRIERRAGTDQSPILRLDGVQDRAGAQALRGQEISLAAQQLPALPEGEFWAHELEGCEVRDGARRVGVVERLIELPSCEALQVRRQDAAALLVPMVGDAVRSVDVGRREIDVDMRFLGEAA